MRREFRVQAVDSFDDEHRALFHLQRLFVELPFPGDEVVTRDSYRFAFQQPVQMVVEQFHVDRFEGLEIVIALFVARGFFAFDEVVVERDQHRVHTEDAELDAEPFRESRLAARRRTRDQHDLRPAFLVLYGYPVGDVTHAFFVQGLAHADQLAAFAFENLRVERPDVRDADDIDPARVFLENLEHFALRHLFFELRRRGAVRYGHPEPFIVFVQVEQVDVSGRNGESPVEITDDVGHLVEGDVQVRTRDE